MALLPGILQTIQRITNDKLGQAGFTNLKYMDADVVLDGGQAATLLPHMPTSSIPITSTTARIRSGTWCRLVATA